MVNHGIKWLFLIIPLFCGTSLSGQPVSSNYPAIPQGWPLSTGLTLDSYLLSNTISILENLSNKSQNSVIRSNPCFIPRRHYMYYLWKNMTRKEKYDAREKMGYFVQRKNAQKQHCIRVPKDEWQTRIHKWDKAKTREAKKEFLKDYPDMRTVKNAGKRISGWRKILNECISILRSNTRNFSMTLGYIHLLTPKNLNDAFFCDQR